ncbi:MAG: CHAT domain-containing protein [Cyanobacteria bacterium J06638_20]
MGDRVREGQALSNLSIVQSEANDFDAAAESLLAAVVQPDSTVTFHESNLGTIDTPQLTVDELAEDARVSAALGRGAGTSTDRAVTALTRSTRQDITATLTRAEEMLPNDRLIPRRASRNLIPLHRLLVEPIVDLLPSDPTDRVIIISQGVLFLVPFAALQDSDRQYLIERHTLVAAPAIQVLAR